MATPRKLPVLARVIITARGVARVEFSSGMAGHIRRLGIQNYAVFDQDGSVAGRASRYEAAARALAAHYGLRAKHVIDVQIVHAYLGTPSLDG